MRKSIVFILAAVLFVAAPLSARAGISDYFDSDGLFNKIKFTNYETFIRKLDTGGFEVIDLDRETVTDKDYLITVFSATELAVQTAPGVFTFDTEWQKGSTDSTYFLGYSVYGIDTISIVSGTIDAITFENPDYDPFSKLDLGTGENLVTYQSDTDWTVTGDIAATVATITGTEWATFGIDTAPDGATFSSNPGFGGRIGDSDLALSNIDGAAGLTFTTPGSDIVGNATIYAPGVGDWAVRSEDPILFTAVPEPATFVLWGSFFMIGGAIALRRRRKA